jgi:colanic acid/amylovoran biosynthesis glycosyltransferase
LKVCYVINQYPMVSHSFIRREILAVERQGVSVLRLALRGWKAPSIDADDAAEKQKTRYVLQQGVQGLGFAVLREFAASPARFARAFRVMLQLSRRSEKPFWKYFVYLAEACVASRWVKENGSIRIHAHFGTNSTDVALFTSLLTGVPYSFTVHGPEEFDRPEALGLPLKIEYAISSYGRSQLYRWTDPQAWSKVDVVHCGLDAGFKSTPEDTPLSPNTLVCVGRLCEQKGQVILLQALRKVVDQGVDCHLVLAGDGPMRKLLEHEAKALHVNERVRITGWIDGAAVRREILAARAMVLPSFAEGLPVVIMEAMALGRPVISTYVAGIPELVESAECGWLVPAGDPDALADAMIECMRADAEKIHAMGRHGRARALARHDVDTEAAKMVRLFKAPQREIVRS